MRGRVVLLGQVRRHDVAKARVVQRREQRSGSGVVEMPELAGDARLERSRVASLGQHRRVVVALEHEGFATGQRALDGRRRRPEVGHDAQAYRSVADDELHGLARIVRDRNGRTSSAPTPNASWLSKP